MSPATEQGNTRAWVVVLAGGIGSRFWPLSTPDRPKQFLPLVSNHPMLRDTIDRLAPIAPLERTLVLTSMSLVGGVRSLLPELPPANIIAEPKAAGTAAALTWAAQEIARRAGREALMISVHADSAIADVPLFQKTLADAARAAASEHHLVTVGIVPQHPDAGLGYIEPGAVVRGSLRRVSKFVEKPSLERAKALVAGGGLWNSGIFTWRVGDLLDEVRACCPEISVGLDTHGDDLAAFFGTVTPVSIDVGVLERSARVLVLPGNFGWSDVGTWAALRAVGAHDSEGNVASGTTYLRYSTGNVVHSERAAVVLYGVSDLVVVTANGLTLVTTVDRSANLKQLLDALPGEVRGR